MAGGWKRLRRRQAVCHGDHVTTNKRNILALGTARLSPPTTSLQSSTGSSSLFSRALRARVFKISVSWLVVNYTSRSSYDDT